MQNDIYLTQPLMERLFPGMKKHKEPMAFSLAGDGFGTKNIISVLIRPSRDGVESFRNSCGSYETMITCYPITENGGKKLGFRLEFSFEDRILCSDGIIDPINPIQRQIIDSLKLNDKIYIWVADDESRVVKIIELEWDYDKHKEVIDEICIFR